MSYASYKKRKKKKKKKKKKKMFANLEFGKLVYIKRARAIYLLLTVLIFRNLVLEYNQVHKKP